MLTIKNKESLIGYRIIGETLSSPWWVVDDITEIVKRDAFGPTANAEEYYVIKMQREDNNETKWIKLSREKTQMEGPYYELSCGREDGTGINRIFVLKETLENRVKLVNAIGTIIRMR